MSKSNQTVVSYRMPNEKEYYSLVSSSPISKNSKAESGFFFSDFDTKTIYNLIDPVVFKNEWKINSPFYNQVTTPTPKESYMEGVEEIIRKINRKELKKVVYSRIKQVPKDKNFNLKNTFNALCNLYKNAFIYCISSPELGTWIGATPETLLHKEQTSFHTVSLAGTRVDNTEWSVKERNEQKIVTQYITSIMDTYSSQIEVSSPYEIKAGEVYHLQTDIQFKLKNKNKVWEIINLLHPTPAICGVPLDESKKLITQLENHKRGLYTGFIGPMGINSHHSLFVNLRNMQVGKTNLNLYLGGGIMGDSIPENEWKETENKAKTLMSVLY